MKEKTVINDSSEEGSRQIKRGGRAGPGELFETERGEQHLRDALRRAVKGEKAPEDLRERIRKMIYKK